MRRNKLQKNVRLSFLLIFISFVPLLYIWLMYLYPWFFQNSNEADNFAMIDWVASRWPRVRSLWNNWQSFNGGILGGLLALIASGIVFYISIHIDNRNRKRLLFAERTFLAESLSENFLPYFKTCVRFLKLLERMRRSDGTFDTSRPLQFVLPNAPKDKDTFVRCMTVSEGDNAEFISGYILKMQICHARFRETKEAFGAFGLVITTSTINTHIFDLVELFAMTGKLMQYARGHSDCLNLVYGDFFNAMQSSNLNITDLADDYKVDSYIKAVLKNSWSPMPIAFS